MMNIKKDTTREVAQIFNIDFENLMMLPCCVFWKNIEGIYQGYNDYGAKSLGYQDTKEIIGKTDTEVFTSDKGKIYRNNDCKVMQTRQQLLVAEKGVLHNTPVVFLSYKIPLFNKDNHLQGMLGLSFTRFPHKKDNEIFSLTPPPLNQLENIFNSSTLREDSKEVQISLSPRERACADKMIQGLTIKQIAKIMNISPRTVETYVERLKIKFNCKNKAELLVAYVEYLSY